MRWWIGLLAFAIACSSSDEGGPVANPSDAGTGADVATADDVTEAEDDALVAGDDVSETGLDTTGEADIVEPLPVLAEWPECADDRPPVVMAHGAFAAGDTWGSHARRFMANGYCPDRLVTFDYDSTLGPNGAVEPLDAAIDALLERTGADQVDLMGHSMGGSLSYLYLESAERAAKVRRYVHIGSSVQDGPADADTPMLNLASTGDPIVAGNTGIEGAENVILTDEDHYAVATSEASFTAVYTFLNDEAPATTEWTVGEETLLAGRALTFGENVPLSGGSLEVWPVDSETAARLGDAPLVTLTVRDDGTFGPIRVDPDTTYEWVVQGAGVDDQPVHYFREAPGGSNPFIYLRAIPSPTSLVGSLLSTVTFNDESAALVLFLESRALLAGEDSLTVDGLELATEQNAAQANSTIAMFLYDENENAVSDETAVELFAAFPFFAGVDLFKSAAPPGTVTYDFNGRRLAVRSWPGSQGAVVAVFE